MSVTNLPDPHDRDLYLSVFQTRTKNLSEAQLNQLVELAYEPEKILTVMHIKRTLEVSKPTARRYRDLILGAREHGPQHVLSNSHSGDEAPSQTVVDRANREAQSGQAHIKEELRRAASRLSAADMSEFVDNLLRKEREKLADDQPVVMSVVKPLLEFKLKFEGLSNTGKEQIIDVQKVLGREGLEGASALFAERVDLMAVHRHELRDAWNAITATVVHTMLADLDQADSLPVHHDPLHMQALLIVLNRLVPGGMVSQDVDKVESPPEVNEPEGSVDG